MKISFYELFDLMAEEALELLSEDTPDSETQSSSEATINGVLEMISQKERPHVFKKKKMIRRLLLVAVIGIGVSAAAVAVANQPIILNGVLLRIGAEEINDANRAYVGKRLRVDDVTVMSEEELRKEDASRLKKQKKQEIQYEIPDFINSIESEEHLLPYTMDTFEAEKKDGYYKTPEVIFTHNAMVIFTKEGNRGWKLKKGQTLHFEVEEYPSEENWKGGGQCIIYMYVWNGKLMNQYREDCGRNELLQKYDLQAEKDGEYYLCLIGASFDSTSIKNGRLYVD